MKCVLELVASNSRAKVSSKAPRLTGLSRTSSKTDFLSHYQAANRIKPLLALLARSMTSTSEIYQRHRLLNLPMDQKFHLLRQAQFWNKYNVIYSTVFDLHGRSSPDDPDDICYEISANQY